MTIVSVSFTDDELKTVEDRMRARGETNRSKHIRDVYFNAGTADDALLGTLSKQVDVLTGGQDELGRLVRRFLQMRTDDVELKLLAGIYVMLYQSVDGGVQALVNKNLDIETIESFISNKKGRS